ncbi:MAG: FAD:protein FMN transferase [Ardenticatenaceae bacterium]|nr:FAD:protein FMN transferase [Anaerolineales bacterium]MCB8938306.1 FAD:protein FMN transferase [Ardenticatenaceae bacterium]MCB8975671.1 FAD:protein FMN transferase [Ardenticatenaceae bacterium]
MKQQPHPASWQSHQFHAMGSQIALWLDSADLPQATAAFEEVEALFAANERALSRFRPDSELMRLNARSGQWVPVSDLLWREIVLAIEMARKTNGRFDPTLLNALAQAGYDRSFEQIVGMGNGRWLAFETLLGRWFDVRLNVSHQAVYLPAGVQLDLGGIAKGDTAQQALALMQAVGPGLVDAGGDLVAGAAPTGFPGWPVALSPPWGDDVVAPENLATFWLAEGAMATSGIDYRSWVHNGAVAHHLINPRTGQPAQTDLLTATVLAPNAATAEAWATATLIAGADVGMELLLAQEMAGLVVGRDGRILATPQMDQLLQGV